MDMNKLSLCMIAKDEAAVIGRCLNSIRGAVDEIIVVDTGSSDATPQIAEGLGAQVHRFPWNDNFSDARNYSLEFASGDWILFLDADEELDAQSRDLLKQVITNDQFEGYFLKLLNYVNVEKWTETNPGVVFRLFRNRNEYRFQGVIHEQILNAITANNQSDRIGLREDIVIRHYGYLKNNRVQNEKRNKYSNMLRQELEKDPENRLLRFQYGEELYFAKRYQEAITELAKAGDGLDPRIHLMPKLLRMLIVSYIMLHQPDAAFHLIQKGIGLLPDYADLYYLGGLINIEKKNLSQAIAFFQKAISLPEQPAFYSSVDGVRSFKTFLELGRIAEAFLNPEEALVQYTKSFRENPDFTPALEKIIALLTPNHDPFQAKACLEKIGDFSTPKASLKLGRLLYQHSAYKLALEYLKKGSYAPEIPSDLNIWVADCLFQQGHFAEAITLVESFLPENSQIPMASFHLLIYAWLQKNLSQVRNLSTVLLNQNLSLDTQRIIMMLHDILVKLDPATPAIKETTSEKSIPATLGEEGIAIFNYLLARALDLPNQELADLLINELTPEQLIVNAVPIGDLYQKYGYLDSADHFFRIGIKNSPESGEAFYHLAKIKQEKGDLIAGVNYYRIALSHIINNPEKQDPKFYVALTRCYENICQHIIHDNFNQVPCHCKLSQRKGA